VKFFFPDSQDQIDPGYDLVTEERSVLRVRQRDDLYLHEALRAHVIDGLLVSKAIVDGLPGAAGKYTLAHRHRMYRTGVRRFFRLDAAPGPRVVTMGDCGAFSYHREDTPPYTVDQVIDFYAECGFDLGISVDHVILGYDLAADHDRDHLHIREWKARQRLTLELAAEFLVRCRMRNVPFEPVGVAQGWSPASYTQAVGELQKIGYTRIAVGGMVPLKTHEILASLRQLSTVRDPGTQLHLLGITRCASMTEFVSLGVTSFDSTSAFRQAFKDDKDNYHTPDRTYTALRVPQVDGNAKLKARIQAGQIVQREAFEREQTCLHLLREYDAGSVTVDAVLEALLAYQAVFDGRRDYTQAYRAMLEEAPWRRCSCGICEQVGIDVAIFRGSERNKRRGFHNVYAFRQRLDQQLRAGRAA
jgi:hypothetical protein